jgi:hypothetical protein
MTVKDAAYRVMKQAYVDTSDNGRFPANARQIMYVARPEVLKLTGGRYWKSSSTFTQGHLPTYLRDYPEETADWDVVFDDGGHWTEPHTGATIGLGTLSVRNYIAGWREDFDEVPGAPRLAGEVPTSGPVNRFRFVLFIEKEGFGPLLDWAQISSRFGIAVMSTKGMSVTAARILVEELSRQGDWIFVLHDFDKSGFSILHTLGHDTPRYQFRHKPNVIDLGLRLEDVTALDLQSELVGYATKVDPRINLRERAPRRRSALFWWSGKSARSAGKESGSS